MPFVINYSSDFEEMKDDLLRSIGRREYSEKRVLEKENMVIVQTKYESFFAGCEVTDNFYLRYNPATGKYVEIHVSNAIRRIDPAVITVHVISSEDDMKSTQVMGNGLIRHTKTNRHSTWDDPTFPKEQHMDRERLHKKIEDYLERQSALIGKLEMGMVPTP